MAGAEAEAEEDGIELIIKEASIAGLDGVSQEIT